PSSCAPPQPFSRRRSHMSALRPLWSRFLPLALVALLPAGLRAQSATVTGRVTGEAGAPLPGANVSIVGMGVGSVTRDDGVYSFTVPSNRVSGQTVTLEARRVGYTPVSVQITLSAGTVTHDFALATSALQLEQV